MSSKKYNKTLIIGATSGIGVAFAAKLVSVGTKVVITGRRVDRLDAFVAQHGEENASAIPLDVTQLDKIPSFASKIAQQHPDIDSIVFNSGIQRSYNFAKPETVDLAHVNEEVTTNYTSYIHLTVALLPLLQKQPLQTNMVYISATLGLCPGLIHTANYNATKGALHNFLLCLREQLQQDQNNNVKVVEVFPPAVQTELHDERFQPNLKNGRDIGMPLGAYTAAMYAGLEKGDDEVYIGPGAEAAQNGFEAQRQQAFRAMLPQVEEMLKKFLK
ncbi:putative short-chain dehydrogenase/oxidoreductase [Exophiala viscosa]|uniref:Short-chain dehydrogenase/oxidoreductase n=1 Tax=Exophiala viscosa TaxID=2486360 RepID=A0AAN6IG16_9EURO|nr:putative short-chain dehydrogenase/oxidoreductase [Exophiala viscosa]KAI1621804.1 putative short-chain dehydrogenase/oxidoreductase [Exophiala viscosa]